jgi:DNA repair photolyase
MEIESVVKRAAEAGVDHAGWILLRLPHELKQIFEEWLETHMPERAGHVMSLIRQASGGRHYDNRFGVRQRGKGPYVEMLNLRFDAACRRYEVFAGQNKETLDCSQFRRPGQRQMTLAFDDSRI